MNQKAKQPSPLRYKLLWVFCILTCVYVLSPIVIVAVNSFNSVAYNTFPLEGFSLQWYRNLFEQKAFFQAFLRSFYVAALTAVFSILIGTPTSFGLVRYKFFGNNALKSFFMSPLVLPKIVVGVSLYMLFIRVKVYGTVASLVVAHTVISMPFVIAIVTSNLVGLDRSLEEASMDLGASRLVTFLRIVLPQIMPGMVISGLFAFITSFDQVETSLFLVRSSNNTLPIEMYLYMEKWQDPTIAALSVMLILFSILIILVLRVVLGKMDIFKILK